MTRGQKLRDALLALAVIAVMAGSVAWCFRMIRDDSRQEFLQWTSHRQAKAREYSAAGWYKMARAELVAILQDYEKLAPEDKQYFALDVLNVEDELDAMDRLEAERQWRQRWRKMAPFHDPRDWAVIR